MSLVTTAELTGALLDSAVAKAEGMAPRTLRFAVPPKVLARDAKFDCCATEDGEHGDEFQPSQRWDHGGPIIERESIMICRDSRRNTDWWANVDGYMSHDYVCGEFSATGPTPLIAAMRAYVAAKLGAEVDL